VAGKRGKSQARRNPGNGGLPGWAWGVLGIVIGIALVIAAPKYLKSDGDGFFRPRPNPDAQPAPVVSADDELGLPDAAAGRAVTGDSTGAAPRKQTDFDFYTLLPGREVPLSDAELAETARAEARREAQAAERAPPDGTPASDAEPLPAPVPADEVPRTPAKPPKAAPATDTEARYLLQAGAFEASGQAEELKARIALLGLGARVESARIGGRTVFRVRMGPYGSASELAEAKRKLEGGGLDAIAIKVE
jgi:cell division protein FtsN